MVSSIGAIDHELVAAGTDHDVRGARRGLEALRDDLDQLIADAVAARLVDVFEVVEIHIQQA